MKVIKYWCNTHRRDASKCLSQGGKEGGIMLPCQIIDCEKVGIEIIDEEIQ